MVDSGQEQTPERKRKPLGAKLFRYTLWTYLVFFVLAMVPGVGLVVGIPFLMVAYLWCYLGLLVATVAFVMSYFVALRRLYGVKKRLFLAFRRSVVLFGAIGLVLLPSPLVVPGYKTFTLGYWMHAKIWLNVDEVRNWSADSNIPCNESHEISREHWPSSLKRFCPGFGTLSIHPETRTVTLTQGGGFGHWGVVIVPKKQKASPLGYAMKLDDGAWVWHEMQ